MDFMFWTSEFSFFVINPGHNVTYLHFLKIQPKSDPFLFHTKWYYFYIIASFCLAFQTEGFRTCF